MYTIRVTKVGGLVQEWRGGSTESTAAARARVLMRNPAVTKCVLLRNGVEMAWNIL